MSVFRGLLLALVAFCLLVLAPAASAAPGDLDPSFGNGGAVRLLESKEEFAIRAVATQPDSKIVIAGGEAPGNTILLRLLPNGELDPSFGTGGKVTTVVPGGSEARAVTVQPDGKIVVAGGAKGAENTDFFIARYLPNGAPDPSFGGGDGVEIVPVGGLEDEAEAVAVGADGKIAATGWVEKPGSNRTLGVVVLREDGTPDTSFGGTGAMKIETSIGDDEGVAVALLDGGSVLLGDENGAGAGDGFTLVKLLPGGGFDPGFGGGDGVVTTPIPGDPGRGGRTTGFALRPNGRIVASGYGYDETVSEPGYDEKFAAVGYLANGDLDPSFAEGGIFSRQIAPGDEAADTVAVTPNGKVILAGFYAASESSESTALLRLQPNGSLDPGFGSGGQVLRGLGAVFGDVYEAGTLDPEERFVTVSTAYLGNETTAVEVSRYLGDPRPPKPIPISGPANPAPHARMKAVPKKLKVGKLKGFSGTASDPGGNGVKKVQIALVKRARGGVKAKASAGARLRCFALGAKQRFKRTKAKKNQCPQVWLTAKGTSKWSFKLKQMLPPGKYVVFARAVDGAGLAETKFSRKLRNRYGFRIVASR